MRTRGNAAHRAGAVALAGLTMVAIGAGSPAEAADQPAPGKGTTSEAPQTGTKPEVKAEPEPEPEDLTAPQRPTLGEASTEPGGTVELDVLAESGSALVVREGAEVVASALATGENQTLSWSSATGPHTYLVIATDAAGNVSDASPLTLNIDATPPAAGKLEVTSGTSRDSRSRWSVVTDPGTAYELIVDGRTVAEGSAKSRTVSEYVELADGRHDVRVELRDAVGNLRTLTDSVTVDIPTLWVAAKDVSEANSTERQFKVAAPVGTRGFLRIPGAGNEKFELTDGRAEVTIDVPEGSFEAPIVIVADDFDRKGTTELAPFEVDLTAPALEVAAVAGAGERGAVSAAITAGEGDTVSWRLVDARGLVALSGEFVADGTEQSLERKVAEGDYDLEVTATDANGNESVERLTASVASVPLINPDVVPALVITLALWVLVGTAVYLRRRGRRVRALLGRGVAKLMGRRSKRALLVAEHEQAVADYQEQLAVFEVEDQAWQQRRDHLTRLVTLAQGNSVEVPATEIVLADDETAFCALPATLVELRKEEGAEVLVEVEAGQLVVTDTRVAFAGTETRDWELADLESIRHLENDRTLMKVSARETVSGVAYADADLVRLYLELAMAERNGTTRSVLMMLQQGVRQHELRRPQAPAPVGPAPVTRRLRGRGKVRAEQAPAEQVVELVVEQAVEQVIAQVEREVELEVALDGTTVAPVIATQPGVSQAADEIGPPVVVAQGEPGERPAGRELALKS
jgi:hypothetical protein